MWAYGARRNRLSRARAGLRRGLTLVEVALVLTIVAIAYAGYVQVQSQNVEALKGRVMADRMQEIVEASKSYMKANYAAVLAATPAAGVLSIPVGRPDAGSPVPNGPAGLPSVQGGGYLPATYVDRNVYNQQHRVMVRRITVAGQPSLETMVVTHGGNAAPDRIASMAAARVGAEGGYFPATTPAGAANTNILGAYGGWQSPAATWNDGAIAAANGRLMSSVAFDQSGIIQDFLYRNDIGVPEANTMNTAIHMNGNEIDGLTTLRAQGAALQVVGALNTSGAITAGGAVTANGTVTASGAASDVVAGRNVRATGQVNAGTSMAAGTNITAGGNITAQGYIQATQDLLGRDVAGRDIVGGRDVIGRRFVDADDTNYGIDGNGNSVLYRVGAEQVCDRYMTNCFTPAELSNLARLRQCRIEYRYYRNTNTPGFTTANSIQMSGLSNTGGLSGWSASGDQCTGHGCGIQMRMVCP